MPVDPDQIVRLITHGLPDAEVEVKDLRGDGRQYAATVISPFFKGHDRIAQHRMVHALLKDKIDDLESLVIKTALP